MSERIPGVSQQEWDASLAAVRAYVEFLEGQVARIPALEARIADLEARLNKNSDNSHKPPSSDGPAKPPRTKSQRTSSGKKPGGQPGHKGTTLERSANPDYHVRHGITSCTGCQRDLSDMKPDSVEERQVFDIPPIKIECTAHELETKTCPDCGTCNTAPAPGILANECGFVLYGPRLRALGVCLMAGHFVAYARIAELVFDLCGAKISPGTFAAWSQKAGANLEEYDNGVANALANDKGAVHFDETGCRSEGERYWLHSASNAFVTHFSFHTRRGTEAMDEIGILPRFLGTAIHDRLPAYYRYEACSHGLCGSHLSRDLRFIWEEHDERWAGRMRKWLLKMNASVNQAKDRGQKRFNSGTVDLWEEEYCKLVESGLRFHAKKDREEGRVESKGKRGRKKQREGKNLVDALDGEREWILRFLKDFTVPFTNNQAERDIRMTKVKMKVSGCFRSHDGARAFCRIRGYLSTAKKQGWNWLGAMKAVFLATPFQPKYA